MKLLPILTVSLLLSSTTFAQVHFPPGGGAGAGGLPHGGSSGQIYIPVDDPILTGVSKSKGYAATYGLSNANLQVGINASGTLFAVQDETQVLARATAAAKVEGLASVFGYTLLGATASIDAEAANATWSYNGDSATVTDEADYARATAFVQVGPWTLLNQTKSYSGDVVSAPSFVKNYTKHIFDVHATYPIIWPVAVTVYVGADAGVALTFTGTLDPMVASGTSIGSKARLAGAADGWLTGTARLTFGAACLTIGMQLDLRLADSGINGSVTADNTAVTGTVGLTEQPLAAKLKLIWNYCLSSGSKTIWNFAVPSYSLSTAL